MRWSEVKCHNLTNWQGVIDCSDRHWQKNMFGEAENKDAKEWKKAERAARRMQSDWKANKTRETRWEYRGRNGRWERDNGENSTRKNKGPEYIKQFHLKYTCQRAVIVQAISAVLRPLPDPRAVKYAMLDQKGALLCPTPDPRSVKPLPFQITGPPITWVEQLCECRFTLFVLFLVLTWFPDLSKHLVSFRWIIMIGQTHEVWP